MDEGPALPQELLDLVIDHLFDDLESLRVCAVVSSSFLHSSRSHLFSHLRVDQRHTIDELHGILARSPVLAAQVGSLHLWDNIMRRQSWLEDYPELAPGVAHLSRILPSLQRFCITIDAGAVHWANISKTFRIFANDTLALPTLTCVEIAGLYGLPFTLFANCPALKSLTLKWVTFDERDNLDFAATLAACADSPPIQLEHLSIDVQWRVLELLSRWILLPQSPLDATQLKSFACTFDSISDHLPVQTLLSTCASTLERLQLKNIRSTLDLSVLTQLRTLCLYTADLRPLLPPPQRVALVVAVASEAEMSQLDPGLVGRSYAGITFIFYPHDEQWERDRRLHDVSAIFAPQVPLLAGQGMVRVLRSRAEPVVT
ncbi:hypothetical protein DFH09DRAFT_255227 [Mycena vulgaris]|nr:hypothetical protein DFH09DRAFT_255227 [Mycena vulgaris]